VNDSVKRLAVANGPNIFQMLLVVITWQASWTSNCLRTPDRCYRCLFIGVIVVCVVTGEDEVWGVDFNAQLVQRHVYVLQRSSVLDSLVGSKSLKMTEDGWAMI